MTESEWLTTGDPIPMLEFARQRASERKLRLFGCACCRRVFPYTEHEGSRSLTELIERFADGELPADQLRNVARSHDRVCHANLPEWEYVNAADRTVLLTAELFEITTLEWVVSSALDAAVRILSWPSRAEFWPLRHESIERITHPPQPGMIDNHIREMQVIDEREAEIEAGFRSQEQAALTGFLRCVLGCSPFHPFTFASEWRTDTALSLAAQMYKSRDFAAMPILADALQDAGCEDGQLLGHCRGPGQHVRGCWVVDLVLGKE